MLNREQILNMNDIPQEEVIVPEWDNASVFVRGMNGKERDTIEGLFMRAQKSNTDLQGIRAKLVCMVVVDSDGNSIFQPGDESALAEKSGKALDRLFTVALKLSGMAPDELESAEKN